MIFSATLDRDVGEVLLAKNAEKQKSRVSSGKLSASALGSPIQWQVLKHLGVPRKEIDEYTVRKFLRGNQIEDWFVGQIKNVVEKQKFVEYRNTLGYIDAIVDTKDWDTNKGIIPVEIKSVTNMKFKRILKEKLPQRGHRLQACLYALALGSEWFAISYVASDDLRVETMLMQTKDSKDEIDGIITTYDEAIKNKIIPQFEAIEKWQGDKLYSNYPDWQELTKEELVEKAKELFKKEN